MVRVLLGCLAVLAAACYKPSLDDCTVECSPTGTCPDGLTCQTGFCRAPGETESCTAPGTPDAPIDVIDPVDAAIVDSGGSLDASPDANLCGNGNVDPGEDCDDDDNDNQDFCRNDCRFNTCGDGVVRTGVEECDDSNNASDACTANCMTCSAGAGMTAATFNTANQHCYRRSDDNHMNAAAIDACRVSRSYPAVYLDSTEETFLLGFFAGATGEYWVGALRIGDPATYAWYTGQTFDATSLFWADGEPNGMPSRDDGVVLIKSATAAAVGLGDEGTNANNGVICEQEPVVIRTLDRHAYRFEPTPANWSDARNACATAGGHLVTIGDTAERDFIETFMPLGNLWVGGSDDPGRVAGATENNFRWIDGTAVNNSVARWDVLPTGGEDSADCVAISGNQHSWLERDCTNLYYYLCEFE